MENIIGYIGNWGAPKLDAPMGITAVTCEGGMLRKLETQFPEINVGQACLDETRGVLYCVNERPEVPGQTLGGQVFALKIDSGTGRLSMLSKSPSYGPLPSDCAVDREGRYLIVSNHSGRNCITKTVRDEDGSYRIVHEYDETAIVLFPLDPEGRIGPPCDIVRHTGSGALPNQQSPHAHCVRRAPGMDLFVVCDKGSDSVYSYKIDKETGRLVCCDRIDGVPGSSPRYCVFHPTLPYLYYNNETKSIVNVVRYDRNGRLTPIGAVSCMENGDLRARGLQSDLRISGDGRNLYTLVRDNSTITVFALNEETGMPAVKQVISCGSTQGGRGMTFSPDGKCLYLAACPDRQVYGFRVDEDGCLTALGTAAEDIAPGVIVFDQRPVHEKNGTA